MSTDPLAWLTAAAAHAEPVAITPRRPAAAHHEPSPAGNPMAWADDAACRGMDTDLFFPSTGSSGGAVVDPQAVAACNRCTVREACTEWALRHERHGYWGGASEKGRRRMRRTRNITLLPDPIDPEDLAS